MAGESIERTRVLSALPAEVWAVLGDVRRMAEWSEELDGVDLLTGDGRSIGSRFRGNNRDQTRTWAMTCVVDRYDEGQALEFHTEDAKGQTRTRWWYRCVRDGSGTAVTEGFERVAKLSRLRAFAEKKVVGDRTEHNARNIDESLRRLAEVVQAREK